MYPRKPKYYEICPICGEKIFGGFGYICENCGWECEGGIKFYKTKEDLEEEGPANSMSVIQYRKWRECELKKDKNFNWMKVFKSFCKKLYKVRYFCPICGEEYVPNASIARCPSINLKDGVKCPKCGWKRDLVQGLEPKLKDGMNKESVYEYRKKYEKTICNKNDLIKEEKK